MGKIRNLIGRAESVAGPGPANLGVQAVTRLAADHGAAGVAAGVAIAASAAVIQAVTGAVDTSPSQPDPDYAGFTEPPGKLRSYSRRNHPHHNG